MAYRICAERTIYMLMLYWEHSIRFVDTVITVFQHAFFVQLTSGHDTHGANNWLYKGNCKSRSLAPQGILVGVFFHVTWGI